MQNFLSDFKFIDTACFSFSFAFGLIFIYGLLPLVSLGLSHFLFLLHFNRKKRFYPSGLMLCIPHFNCKRRKFIL